MRFYLLLVVLASSSISHSQHCDSIFKKEIDKTTKSIKYSSDLLTLDTDNGKFQFIVAWGDSKYRYMGNSLLIAFQTPEKLCIDLNNPIIFLLQDETQISFRSLTDFNCMGLANLIFAQKGRDTKAELLKLKQLCDSKIKTIRVEGDKEYHDFKLNPEGSTLFQAIISCGFSAAFDNTKAN